MSGEVPIGLKWIIDTLDGDANATSKGPGGAWDALAPDGTPTPYYIVSLQSGFDVCNAYATRLLTNATYQIKAVGEAGNPQAVVDANAALDALFGDRKNVGIPGGLIVSCYRTSPLQYKELDPTGAEWSHIGGLYDLQIQAL